MSINVEKVENGFLLADQDGKVYIAKTAYDCYLVIELIFSSKEDEDES